MATVVYWPLFFPKANASTYFTLVICFATSGLSIIMSSLILTKSMLLFIPFSRLKF
ncbi:MAG: hypothetical protein H7199_01280 [Burkholderiales bacterium]|nr:hypothetical protein [Flavobacterium sp.]